MIHDNCRLSEHCGHEGCPAAQASRKRTAARRGEWSPLQAPSRDSYHHLDGQPVSCGSRLELQALRYHDDDYGSYTEVLQEGVSVRFEILHTVQGRIPMLHIAVGGHEFTAKVDSWMRFRWPRSLAS